ncbi:hypothetical protein [Plantactinospora sp. KLBMP9567]|uniref:golvesin C-terminal-like domain-containing protein n=1 Tax=Plantactinospora sp. KLBMP9567 TaxID=3085900 RepID=UPI002980BC09|nr:hypothetical protein [Plantactinospora sp. KLBMP9567]MDW5327462.1 hypothetical protein [Plantactinospora sp. KLBMP9567]
MSTRRSGRRGIWAVAAALAVVLAPTATARAQPKPDADLPAQRPVPRGTDEIPSERRAELLGPGWEQSADLAWTTAGDADGFHVLTADESDGYRWRTLATLSEPGLEADSWIGNACVTNSGRKMVVVYAPRTFTNETELFDRGGFTAVIDMRNGETVKLPVQSSIAYFNPGCGATEEAVLTQGGDEDLGRTRLIRVDTRSAVVRARVTVPGQLTSPVPTAQGIVAADNGALVRVDGKGVRRVLAPTSGVPFKLAADRDGGVVFMERNASDQASVRRAALPTAGRGRAASVSTLAAGPLNSLDVTSSRGGRVFVTGAAPAARRGPAPASVSLLDVPKGSQVSTQGRLAITSVLRAQPDPRTASPDTIAAEQVTIAATVLATRRSVEFSTTPDEGSRGAQGANAGRQLSPAVRTRDRAGARALAGDPHSPADLSDRYCSVPRNDPANQVMQPKPRQVEWAVDQAVRNALHVQRPANWKNLNMAAYTPQGLFPWRGLTGGGWVPAQVLLGIAAQESNLWQAARFAVPGVTANPLIGNYFGVDIYNDTEADDWTINWADADCGYGVMQVTDGMRLAGREKPGEQAHPYHIQRAIALDFAVNIAAGLDILVSKWNQTRAAGMMINNGDSSKIENWFYAVWAYNSGFYPDAGNGSPWGVGWANNPVNPRYPANRNPFLETTYQDAAHPQDWPYPEKVMGWAGHPVEVLEAPDTLVSGYRAAWWNGGDTIGRLNRALVKPPVAQFCDSTNQCDPDERYLPNAPDVVGEPAGPCGHKDSAGRFDLRCWYHQSSTWKTDCSYSCGNELLRFDPGYAYQEDGTAYSPRCVLDGLPSNAQIVDDVPDGTPSVRPNCGRPWTNAGTFQFTFKSDGSGQYPGKIDTHQIGGGFGGHFWFTHTRTAADLGGRLEVNATWKLNSARNGPMRILVALPDHGAHTKFARYVVKTANGDRVRVIKQPGTSNRWVSLGAFMFNGVPQVTLTSVTPDGDGSQDVAFDAMAFVPISGTYREDTVEAVAVFDEDQDITTNWPGSWMAGPLKNPRSLYDWGMERTGDLLGLPACTAPGTGNCLQPAIKTFAQNWQQQVSTAGWDPVNHPDGASIGRWIGFAQPYTDRPTGANRPSHFDDDDRFKIKTKATVAFVADSSGQVVPGSEWAEYEHRTGNTHLPQFVRELFGAVQASYGIAPPDLGYRVRDLNAHNGAYTSVDPVSTGVLPGRAYAYAGIAPKLRNSAGAETEVNAVCVLSRVVTGGSIGYRPMLGVDGPSEAFQAWVDRLEDSVLVARPIAELAENLREMFFDRGAIPGLNASMFGQAPPIWQELGFETCADGTIRQVNSRHILLSSWMPDQYLYRNGRAMTQTGAAKNDASNAATGFFDRFSNVPGTADEHPFGDCDTDTGRSGNPWGMSPTSIPPQDAGYNPASAHLCVGRNYPTDPSHSS